MDNTTYYQRNRDVALNKAKEYYKNKQETNIVHYLKKIRIKKENMEKNRYHVMSEEKKQELKEYQKRRYHELKESMHIN